jgi:hypothetical protein
MERAAGDDVERLVGELGTTLRRVLSESTQVAHCLNRMRSEGYDVSVALEATIGFARAEGREETTTAFDIGIEHADPAPFEMTPLDKRFLRSLKIAVDEED